VHRADSDCVTEGVRIRAAAQPVPEETDPDRPLYVFAYRIRMVNEGDQPARLESRHWVVLDANGERRDVRGPGVVGQFPYLEPNDSYEYTVTMLDEPAGGIFRAFVTGPPVGPRMSAFLDGTGRAANHVARPGETAQMAIELDPGKDFRLKADEIPAVECLLKASTGRFVGGMSVSEGSELYPPHFDMPFLVRVETGDGDGQDGARLACLRSALQIEETQVPITRQSFSTALRQVRS